MKYEPISISDSQPIEGVADQSGKVALACSEVGGILDQVNRSSAALRDEHARLLDKFGTLEEDQSRVSHAADEARLLSQRAIDRLSEGKTLIEGSLEQINSVLGLVDILSTHITGFAAAMSQVEKCSRDIEKVAETTSILSLNATIEAMRAGESGTSFVTVANEVKVLAAETRAATDEIRGTINTLSSETVAVSDRIAVGMVASEEAKCSVAKIKDTIAGVSEMVREVDNQNDQIAQATGTISGRVSQVQSVLSTFDEAEELNEQRLRQSIKRMRDLERSGSDMFDSIVRAGLSPIDSDMVRVAQEYVSKIVKATEAALAEGLLNKAALFDSNYIAIPNSNPERFRTTLTDWADANWRPIIDECLAYGRPVKMLGLSDKNGFMPTHASERSRQPIGDIEHDTAWCRNGRKILGPSEERAKANTQDFLMAVHRQEDGQGGFYIVRTVYMPVVIDGERWGDAELAYILDDKAWPKY